MSTIDRRTAQILSDNSAPAERMSPFDRFAEKVASATAHATFFLACLVLVLLWAPSIFVIRNVDTWQLVINTATTIITFLLVALLQNSSHREACATQAKLDCLLEAVGRPDAAGIEKEAT